MTDYNIIIPTYNRPDYLRRILGYYDSFGEDFKIIVSDSSSDENKELNRKTISSVSNLDIKHLDNYPPETNPYHKLADVVNYVATKYCVLCADDDFVTPNGIKEAVDFLENSPDFRTAHGQYISFFLKNKRNNLAFYWKGAYPGKSITFPEADARLVFHLSNYTPTFFAVHRTDSLKMVYQESVKSKVDPVFFGELLPSMLTIVYGKMKRLEALYAARDEEARLEYWPSLKDAIGSGVYNEEYAKFKDCLATHLSQQSQLDIEESKRIIDEAMSAYMSVFMKVHHPSKSKMGLVLEALHLPDWMDKRIRRAYEGLKGSNRTRNYSTDMAQSSKSYEDFSRIRHHVLSNSGINAE